MAFQLLLALFLCLAFHLNKASFHKKWDPDLGLGLLQSRSNIRTTDELQLCMLFVPNNEENSICTFQSCYGDQITVSLCGRSCEGDTFIRVYNSSGLQTALIDVGNDCFTCHNIEFEVNRAGCMDFDIHGGCLDINGTCFGEVTILKRQIIHGNSVVEEEQEFLCSLAPRVLAWSKWCFQDNRLPDPCDEREMGLGCTSDRTHITSITFPWDMIGPFPNLTGFPYLLSVYASAVPLSGPLPVNFLPPSLTLLSIQSSELSGSLPSFLSLPKLQTLELSNNKFLGKLLPNQFPPSMMSISISSNALNDSLPSFASLVWLHTLYLTNNQFSGTLSDNQFPPSLRNLDLSNNFFTGTLPSFQQNSDLLRLKLTANNFNGTLSASEFPESLIVLDLKYNRLSEFSPSICNLNVVAIYLAGNLFQCYPSCFAPSVDDFMHIVPRCLDEIDVTLCSLSAEWKMEEVIRDSIAPGDPIYRTLGDSPEMISLDALYFEISFDPASDAYSGVSVCFDPNCLLLVATFYGSALKVGWPGVGNMAPMPFNGLVYLLYHRNLEDITGVSVTIVPYRRYRNGWNCQNVSRQIPQATSVMFQIEAVDYCDWSGIVCSGGDKGVVTEINLNAFGIVGENHVAKLLTTFPSLLKLNLGNNALYGELNFVPHQRLTYLDVAFNAVNGTIPCTINQLKDLQTLALKQNQLTGTIPSCLAEFGQHVASTPAGIRVDLRYNQFSGQVETSLCTSPPILQLLLNNNPLLACYAYGNCTAQHDDSLESCAPTFMPTAPPVTSSASNEFPTRIVVGVVIAAVAVMLTVGYFMQRRYAKIASEGILAKYDGLPLHKSVVQGIELVMKDIESNASTIVKCADDGKSLLRLILEMRPGYNISNEGFQFIVKALLFQGISQEFRVHWATLIQSEDDLVMEAIHLILEDHSGSVDDFVYGKADTGRAFVEMASYRVSKLMMRHTYLHKQFTLNESFEYRSKYCEVIIAEYHPLLDEDADRFKEKNAFTLEMPDITSEKNASSKFHSSKGKQKLRSSETDIVALKFIKNRDSFLTERTIMNELAQLTMISQEQVTSKPTGGRYEDHFLRLFHSYDGDDKEDEDAKLFRRDSMRKNYADYPYCLVLEAARINLQSYFVYSDVLGNDWEEIERIITHVLSALQFLHNHGIVHGDLKPANIMITTDGRYKLIDLDASTMIGKPLGKRVSTAYCPPEMILEKPFPRAKLILSESSAIPQYNYLLAHPSYDLWSAGILFFYLASGGLPFAVNNYDCISSEAELINLFHWTDDYKSQKIQSVMNHIQSSLELSSSHLTSTTVIQVHNLLTLLLQKLPSKRPSVGQTLQHPFFTKKLQPRMAGHEATYDVFISYRVASDSKHAGRLYRELTEVHGLRVWLDKYCLEAGKNWERGFCEGLIKSSAFVCLISRDGMFHSEHPNQNFVKLNPESSACDNCLLEWRLALEMQERGMLTGIFPLFVGKELPGQDIPLFNAEETQQSHGEVDIEQGTAESKSVAIQYGNFFEQCKNYPYTPATLPLQPIDSVEKKINELLDHFGYVASYLSAQGASACSVKNVWTRIVSNQGAFIEGEYEAAVERVGKGIAEMIAHNRTGSQ